MFRQASNRYKRSKGFKVKHAFQVALLVAVSIWLLYQVKHSHDKRQANKNANIKVESGGGNVDGNVNGWNSDAFGRKGKFQVPHEVPATPHAVKNEGNAEEEEGEETKESQNKSEENGNEDRGIGDDEIDRRDEGKTEEDEKQSEHEGKTEEENQHEHEEKIGEDENENEHEKVIENGLKGEETKEAEMEDGEQGGDVGANFIHLKQDIENAEESQEIVNEQRNQEETPVDEKVEEQSENEQENAPPLGHAEGKMHNNSLESKEIFEVVPEQNKTATTSHNPSEESGEEKLPGSNKTEETDLKKSETTLVDASKDVLTLHPNAKMEDEKFKEEKKAANVTLVEEETDLKKSETTLVDASKDVLTLDPNAKTEDEKLKEEKKATDVTLVEDHHGKDTVEDHQTETGQNDMARHESETKSLEDHHGKDTVEDHQTETGQNDMARQESETKSLDETSTSGSMNETIHTNKTDKEDTEIVTSLDQSTAKNGTELSNETEAKDLGSSDQNGTTPGKNLIVNLTTESGQTDDGDGSSQDIPVENEGSNRADLETLPQTEVDVQNSEELSVQ